MLDIPMLNATNITADCIGRSLIPLRLLYRLLGGKNFHEPVTETIEHIGISNMPVQAHGHKLREHVDSS